MAFLPWGEGIWTRQSSKVQMPGGLPGAGGCSTFELIGALLFAWPFKLVLTFESVNEILKCDNSTESYWAALFFGTVYSTFGKVVLTFESLGWNIESGHSNNRFLFVLQKVNVASTGLQHENWLIVDVALHVQQTISTYKATFGARIYYPWCETSKTVAPWIVFLLSMVARKCCPNYLVFKAQLIRLAEIVN